MREIPFNLGWQRTIGDRWSHQSPCVVDLPDDYIHTLPRHPDAPGRGMVGFFPSENAEYSHSLTLPENFRGTLLLYLDGAYEKAEIFVDYNFVHSHPYGYTGDFSDLARWVKKGTQTLRIATSCQHPASRWYTGGGLYRGAVLYEAGKVYIHPWDAFVTTHVEKQQATIQVDVNITNRGAATSGKLTASLSTDSAPDQILSNETISCSLEEGTSSLHFQLMLHQPELWSLENPFLYRLSLSIHTAEDIDTHQVIFGIRTIEIDPQRGFRLNGHTIKLRGGCIHHDNGFLGAAAFPRSEERKIELLKSAGFNAIRTAHNPPSTSLLNACDRLGMLVLDESFDCWCVGKTPMDYHQSFEKWWDYDTAAMIRRDRNHPCIFCYSIGNEIIEFDGASDGILWGKRQADLIRSLDPTRPITSGINMACGRPEKYYDNMNYQQMAYDMAHTDGIYNGQDFWGKSTEKGIANLDIAGYNYMYNRYTSDRKKYPTRIIMGTETMPFYAYENMLAVQNNPQVIGDFVWVAMDFLGEAGMGGIVWGTEPPKQMPFEGWPWLSSYQGDLDMTGWRRPINYYRNIVWGMDQGIHLFSRHPKHAYEQFYGNGWHWEYVLPTWTYEDEWVQKDTAVVAYANCDEVIFLLNDKLVARVKPERYIARAIIPYEPGTLCAIALKNGQEIATDSLQSAGAPYTIRLSADRTVLRADGMDLSYIRAELIDEKGVVCFTSQKEITVTVYGAGKLVGVGSGNPKTEESYILPTRQTFEGSITAAIRSETQGGDILVSFVADHVLSAQIKLAAQQSTDMFLI